MSLLLIGLALAASLARANCEVGAYTIHTIADYKPFEPNRIVLLYRSERPTEWRFEVNANDGSSVPYPKLLKLKTLAFQARTCTLKKPLATRKPADEAGYNLVTSDAGCEDLLRRVPARGYAIADLGAKRIRILDEMTIDAGELAKTERDTLEHAIDAQLATLKLAADRGLMDKNGTGRIDPSAATAKRFEHTIVRTPQAPFVLSTEILTFPDVRAVYKTLAETVAKEPVEFPVIFLRTPGAEPRYIGDGSECASTRISEQSGAVKAEKRALAPDRYKLTHVFDADGDQAPDLFEVNGSVAYLIDGAKLWVVQYGQGC